MKKLLFLFSLTLIALSCSENDDPIDSQANPILGEWKLTKITSDGTRYPALIDYSDKRIIYNFTPFLRYDTPGSGYELIITGEENAAYPNGKYEYHFREAYLEPGPWDEDDVKVLSVSINGAKYGYNLKDGFMTLGLPIEGAAIYNFERVK